MTAVPVSAQPAAHVAVWRSVPRRVSRVAQAFGDRTGEQATEDLIWLRTHACAMPSTAAWTM